MRVDGRAIAEELYIELGTRVQTLGRAPTLGILVCTEDPVIDSFVRTKAKAAEKIGVEMMRRQIPTTATTEEVMMAARALAQEVDGLIMQLPLGQEVDVNAALSVIPDNKDVDALSSATGEHLVDAPVARAVIEILNRAHVEVEGKRVVVVGEGRLVGAPTAALLKRLKADVSFFTLEKGSIDDLKDADILVCGAGNPGFIKPEHLKEGVVLIDAGASELGGKVVGDVDPVCEAKAFVFTPVPGGVGPVAVAMIFKNLLDLIDMKVSR